MKRILQQTRWQGYLCLIIGMILLILSGPQWNSSLATWIYPILLLRFLTLFKSRWSLPLFFIIFLCSLQIAYLNVIPVPGLGGLMILIVITFSAFLPYLLYSVLKWSDDFFSTLLFPIALVAVEYAFSFGPYGTWGSIANTQYPNKILLQLASLTGQWGISFVIGWTAAVIGWIWSQPLSKATLHKTKAYFICMALVFVFGFFRWQTPHSSEIKVKVAGVAVKLDWGQFHLNELSRETTDPKPESQRIFLLQSADQVLTMASQEAKKGANIVLGAEGNILLHQKDEPAFLQKAAAVAKSENIYLFLGMAVLLPDKKASSIENKVVIISPEGKLLYQYFKANPVPGEHCIKGDGILPVINSRYGRLSTVICYDADFPRLVKQAGQKGIDLLLIPANDWKYITPYHTMMALFRGIENGTSVIREATNGLAVIADANGKIHASKNYFDEDAELRMSAEVPVERKWALYPIIGDLFAIICCLALLISCVVSVFHFYAKLKEQSVYA